MNKIEFSILKNNYYIIIYMTNNPIFKGIDNGDYLAVFSDNPNVLDRFFSRKSKICKYEMGNIPKE